MRLVQISDLHLGRSFAGLGVPAHLRADLARASLDALALACNLVGQREAAAMLIPGDLFDRPEIDEEILAKVQPLLGGTGRPVLVSPGNHDCYGPMSIWNNSTLERLGLTPWPRNVHVFSSRGLSPYALPEGDVVVYGHRVEGYHSLEDSPLGEAILECDARFKVLSIHGALGAPRHADLSTLPFTADQLAALGADYAAVGHYHRHLPIEHRGRLLGAYAGTAVPGETDEDPHGGVLVVTLGDNGPQVDLVTTYPGRITTLPVYGEPPLDGSTDAVERALGAARSAGLGRQDIVTVRMLGLTGQPLDTTRMMEALSEHFRHVTVCDDTEPVWGPSERSGDFRHTVEGRFIETMQKRIEEAADAEERLILNAALRYGRRALRGLQIKPPPGRDRGGVAGLDHAH